MALHASSSPAQRTLTTMVSASSSSSSFSLPPSPVLQRHHQNNVTSSSLAAGKPAPTDIEINLAIPPSPNNDGSTVAIVEEEAMDETKKPQPPERRYDRGPVDPKSGLNNCEIAGIIIGCILVFLILVYLGIKFIYMWQVKENYEHSLVIGKQAQNAQAGPYANLRPPVPRAPPGVRSPSPTVLPAPIPAYGI
ncbi:hypothetical protein BJ166DRAFT_629956 [Pestalotiopsis sp. NC0098]|nr:hypothetical protein BJ166DRAFT_629956 [Pestalotiopsis sp. NC0098]